MQGQDPRGARLAVRARTEGLTAADVDRALSEERSLLITWLNRGTLHLVRSEDYPLAAGADDAAAAHLRAPAGCARRGSARRRPSGRGDDRAGAGRRGAADPARSCASGSTRPGVPTEGQALVHLSSSPRCAGSPCAARWSASEHAYVLVRDWLGPQQPVDRDAALAELARRYLVGHGPADDRDLARWAGLPLRDARAGLAAIASELDEREDGLVDLAKRPPAGRAPAAAPARRLRPAAARLDLARGILGPHKMLVTINGIFRPFALVDGRAVATWRLAGGKVTIEPLGKVTKKAAAALEADAGSRAVHGTMSSRRWSYR